MEFEQNIFKSELAKRVFMTYVANRIKLDAIQNRMSREELIKFIDNELLDELRYAFIDIFNEDK